MNIKTLLLSFVTVTSLGCSSGSTAEDPSLDAQETPKIIFDTDMGPDYDDIGAIAMLHALADSGECEILATVASDGHATIAPTIEIYNRYFGRADLAVGAAVAGAPDFTAPNGWNDSLITRFGEDLRTKPYDDAVTVYRRVLADQPDNSVTILTVGFLSNIDALLDSSPDEYSDLNGVDLVDKKVKKLVSMAGAFPQGREFNINEHPEAAVNTFNKWPKPILFSGFEIGVNIMTGGRLAQRGGDDPVSVGYTYNFKTYAEGGETNRNSWDQTAVLASVRDPDRYFYVNGPGKFSVNDDGSNFWDADTDAQHYFLVHKYPYQILTDTIDELMLHQPKN